MNRISTIIVFVTLTIIISNNISAQTSNLKIKQADLTFNHIGIERGLSQSTVFCIVQDAEGFLWFGTDDGLNRYDGYSVTVFKHSDTDSNSLSDNSILCLLNDKKGDLWIGTRLGGVDHYVPSENKFYNYQYDENNSSTIRDNSVYALYEDSKGNIWIGTSNGLDKFDREKKNFNYFFINKEGKSGENAIIRAICEDKDQHLWIGTSDGLYKMDLTDPNLNKNLWPVILDGTYIYNLYIDRSGVLWIGTYGKGLYKYDVKTNHLSHFLSNSKTGFGNFITSIFEDPDKNLWISAYDAGLNVFNLKAENCEQLMKEPVMSLFQDKSGIVWMGTFTDGVEMYDSHTDRFNHYYDKTSVKENKNKNLITSILQSKDGQLWIGTYGNGVNVYSQPDNNRWNHRSKTATFRFDENNPRSISSDRIVALSETPDGSIWVGTENDGLNSLNKKSGKVIRYKNNPKVTNSISSNRIVTLFYDHNTDFLWIGYLNGNIDRFHISKNKFKHYHLNSSITAIYKDKNDGFWVGTFSGDLYEYLTNDDHFIKQEMPILSRHIMKNGIYSINEDSSGIIWLGTHGSGLIGLDRSKNSIKNFTENNGLPNNIVYGILPDKSGNLWLSTNKGLSKFDPKEETFRNYDANDGLQSNEFNQGAYFESKTGELFFGGVNGFNAFFPENIKDNQYVPPVYVTTFKIFDKILPLPNPIRTDKLILSYYQNFFSFDFVALNYTSPEKNQYAYMLEGFDKQWHKVSSQQRYASYTNLDPGKYILRVKASNNDGIWNEMGASIPITITPPFWMEWWFRITILFIASSLTIGSVRYFIKKKIRERTRKLEQETAIERERTRIARDMHDDLGAKVTEISILSELAKLDVEKERSAINHIKEISLIGKKVVKALDEIVWSVNPKNDTLESLIDYVIQHIEQFLSMTRILYRLDIPPEIPSIIIPFDLRHNVFLVIQEALNNVVKHSSATEVYILMDINESTFFISVRDNGKGFSVDLFDPPLSREQDSEENILKKKKINLYSNGLGNMKKRITETGGSFMIKSEAGRGTEIKLEVPLQIS